MASQEPFALADLAKMAERVAVPRPKAEGRPTTPRRGDAQPSKDAKRSMVSGFVFPHGSPRGSVVLPGTAEGQREDGERAREREAAKRIEPLAGTPINGFGSFDLDGPLGAPAEHALKAAMDPAAATEPTGAEARTSGGSSPVSAEGEALPPADAPPANVDGGKSERAASPMRTPSWADALAPSERRRLEEALEERTRLLTHIFQDKMFEQVALVRARLVAEAKEHEKQINALRERRAEIVPRSRDA